MQLLLLTLVGADSRCDTIDGDANAPASGLGPDAKAHAHGACAAARGASPSLGFTLRVHHSSQRDASVRSEDAPWRRDKY